MAELYPYQTVGARFLSNKAHALLADECGLGKSAQAIVATSRIWQNPLDDEPQLAVVCPASVRVNWIREIQRFWPESESLPYYVAVESYDRVSRGAWDKVGRIEVLILDEAHYLKNKTAKRTKAIYGPKCDGVGGLVEHAEHVFLLTGTPMPNHPAELWTHLRALAPETIINKSGKPDSYWQFVNRYCVTKDNGFGVQIVGGKRHDVLREKIEPFMLRRTKAEVLPDLPPIRFDELYVEGRIDVHREMAEGSALVAKVLAEKGVEGLREIAAHVATLRRLTGLAKVAPTVEWVKDWIEGGGKKLVVFAHHRDVIEGLREGLGGRCVVVTGSTPGVARQAAIDEFQTDGTEVFIGQIQAAGTGINLTAASDVLFVEQDWTPANNLQAAMRVHRLGQGNACLVRTAVLAGSVDEQIQRALTRKMSDIAKIVS